MRKTYFGKQLKRDTNERKALFKNLIMQLVINERIETTEAKAKAIRSQTEKLVTKAKKSGGNATYFLQPYLSGVALDKMISDIAPRFSTRNGGYTRIIKTGNRLKDNADMAIMEWVDGPVLTANLKTEKTKKEKKSEKKQTKTSASTEKVKVQAKEKPTKVTTGQKIQTRRKAGTKGR